MSEKNIFTAKNISTVLVEMVLLIILGYPNTSSLRAPIIIIAFAWTILKKGFRIRTDNIYFIHGIWAVSFYILILLSRNWALFPQGVDDIKNNVLWCVMITIIMADYVISYNISADYLTKIMLPVAIVLMITVLFFGSRDDDNRLYIANNANVLGIISVIVFVFILYSIITKSRKGIFIYAIGAILLTMTMLSGSRNAIVSLLIYAVGFFQFRTSNVNIRKTVIRIGVTVILVLLGYFLIMNIDALYDTIGRRVESLFDFLFRNEKADGSVNTRINMINRSFDIFKDHPVLGIGANNFKYYTYYNTYSHNGYTEILNGLGIVGVVVYYVPIIIITVSAYKNWKAEIKDAILPLCSMVSFLVCEISEVTYFAYFNYCILGIAAGMTFCMKRYRCDEMNISSKNTEIC